MIRKCFLLAGLMAVMLCAPAHAQGASRVPAPRNNKNGTEVVADKARRTLEELEREIQECDVSVEDLLQQLADNADIYGETCKAPTTQLPVRARRGASGDRFYGNYLNDGAPAFAGGYPGDFGLAGGYRGYNKGYGSRGYVDFDKTRTESPVLTFVKGFRPGKSYIEKGRVVRNYYRHGTYDVALQHYKFIPVIKVVPFTTYNTVGYTDKFATVTDYAANICQACYHGYPKIDVAATKGPYNYLTRRLVYLPETYQIEGHGQPGFGFHAPGGYSQHPAGYDGAGASSHERAEEDWVPTGANGISLP